MKQTLRASSVLFLSLFALLLAACGGTDQAALQTAAAATLNAQVAEAQNEQALQTANAEATSLQATVNALATENAALQLGGTATAGAQATLAAVAPQVIPPDGAICRSGPDAGFAKVADLEPGVPVDAFGRSADGEWWQVASPSAAGQTCWVFAEDEFTFLGEVLSLPLVAGPSLPTATFAPTHAPGIAVRYVDDLSCGTRIAILSVTNLGNQTYQSAIVVASDSADNELGREDGNNEFLTKSNACPDDPQPTLGPEQTRYVAVPIGGAPAGDTLIARVTVCTETGYRGECYSSTVRFVP